MKLALGMDVSLSPGDVDRWGPSTPPPKGSGAPFPNFRFISIVAKRLDASRCQVPLGMEVGGRCAA